MGRHTALKFLDHRSACGSGRSILSLIPNRICEKGGKEKGVVGDFLFLNPGAGRIGGGGKEKRGPR